MCEEGHARARCTHTDTHTCTHTHMHAHTPLLSSGPAPRRPRRSGSAICARRRMTPPSPRVASAPGPSPPPSTAPPSGRARGGRTRAGRTRAPLACTCARGVRAAIGYKLHETKREKHRNEAMRNEMERNGTSRRAQVHVAEQPRCPEVLDLHTGKPPLVSSSQVWRGIAASLVPRGRGRAAPGGPVGTLLLPMRCTW